LGRLNQIAQEDVAPIGPTAVVYGATEVSVSVAYTAYATPSDTYSATGATGNIEDALLSLFEEIPIGGRWLPNDTTGRLYLDELTGAIKSAVPSVFHVTYTSPADALSISAGAVPVLSSLTGSIVLVQS
jgi:hypothetical protein